jgi:hypothetical protein
VRLRRLSEAECYARCYGDTRAGENVRVIRAERQPRAGARVTGETLREGFERRLDAREPEAA